MQNSTRPTIMIVDDYDGIRAIINPALLLMSRLSKILFDGLGK